MAQSPFLRLSLMAAGLTLLSPAGLLAEELVCRTSIGAVTLDNVRVPAGARCTLTRTQVTGTIKVENNATLVAYDVVVIGNVQGETARNVRILDNSRIGGSVQVKQGAAATVSDSRVSMDIQYDSNSGPLNVLRNQVGGNVQAFQNRGALTIRRNTINGNLQCKENAPAPTGDGNVVGGQKEDQCLGL